MVRTKAAAVGLSVERVGIGIDLNEIRLLKHNAAQSPRHNINIRHVHIRKKLHRAVPQPHGMDIARRNVTLSVFL